jgi:hypothetical protein
MANMGNDASEKIVASVSVDFGGKDARIEKLSVGEDGKTAIRILAWTKGGSQAEPLVLSEEQLIELLHKASHAGVLSQDFIGKLKEKIEI